MYILPLFKYERSSINIISSICGSKNAPVFICYVSFFFFKLACLKVTFYIKKT